MRRANALLVLAAQIIERSDSPEKKVAFDALAIVSESVLAQILSVTPVDEAEFQLAETVMHVAKDGADALAKSAEARSRVRALIDQERKQ